MKYRVLIVPFFIALGFAAVLVACSKSSSDTGGRATLIVKAPWKYDASGVDLNKDGTIDIPDTTQKPCEIDNTYLFKKDSTGVADEGPTKCNVADPQTSPFTWKLTTNQTILSVTGSFLNGDATISSMTDAKIVLFKDTTLSGLNFRYIISFKH